jgi:hypothetical protein
MSNIQVKSTLPQGKDGGFPVALFEQGSEYEGGEIFIGDDQVYNVPATAAVMAAISDHRLEQVSGEPVSAAPTDDKTAKK